MIKIRKLNNSAYIFTMGEYNYRWEETLTVSRVDKNPVLEGQVPDVIKRMIEWEEHGAVFNAGEWGMDIFSSQHSLAMSEALDMKRTVEKLKSMYHGEIYYYDQQTVSFFKYCAQKNWFIPEISSKWERPMHDIVGNLMAKSYNMRLETLTEYHNYFPEAACRYFRQNFNSLSYCFSKFTPKNCYVLWNGCTKNQIWSLWFRNRDLVLTSEPMLNSTLKSAIAEAELSYQLFEDEIHNMQESAFLHFMKNNGKKKCNISEVEIIL